MENIKLKEEIEFAYNFGSYSIFKKEGNDDSFFINIGGCVVMPLNEATPEILGFIYS